VIRAFLIGRSSLEEAPRMRTFALVTVAIVLCMRQVLPLPRNPSPHAHDHKGRTNLSDALPLTLSTY
jgi:hypothetical protein